MFTGIIEELGRVRRIGGGRLAIDAQRVLEDVHIGDSIAVNGICLTVTSFDARGFTADVMPETVRRTSLDGLAVHSPVNLERALAVGARLGGHIVSGHIDGTGMVETLTREGNALLLSVTAAPTLVRGIVEKGSVALDGISLTVVSVTDDAFTVSLIPHTLETTNLHTKKAGSRVNIETDILGKYVERFLTVPGFLQPPSPRGGGPRSGGGSPLHDATKRTSSPSAGAITKEFLLENGF
ncbi:riboflavin synthase [Selenomonas sp.]|uniref:riboflavin synthase n=1 Tax=Selenomonas sp. TaxID=2053611 RepID=UPI0025CD332B|nr:riboflavin synthase [Selenomonas sp.]MCI6283978.1 riboflavin synthase [Selenomonas sp.]